MKEENKKSAMETANIPRHNIKINQTHYITKTRKKKQEK